MAHRWENNLIQADVTPGRCEGWGSFGGFYIVLPI